MKPQQLARIENHFGLLKITLRFSSGSGHVGANARFLNGQVVGGSQPARNDHYAHPKPECAGCFSARRFRTFQRLDAIAATVHSGCGTGGLSAALRRLRSPKAGCAGTAWDSSSGAPGVPVSGIQGDPQLCGDPAGHARCGSVEADRLLQLAIVVLIRADHKGSHLKQPAHTKMNAGDRGSDLRRKISEM